MRGPGRQLVGAVLARAESPDTGPLPDWDCLTT